MEQWWIPNYSIRSSIAHWVQEWIHQENVLFGHNINNIISHQKIVCYYNNQKKKVLVLKKEKKFYQIKHYGCWISTFLQGQVIFSLKTTKIKNCNFYVLLYWNNNYLGHLVNDTHTGGTGIYPKPNFSGIHGYIHRSTSHAEIGWMIIEHNSPFIPHTPL